MNHPLRLYRQKIACKPARRLLAWHRDEASSNSAYLHSLARGLLEILSARTFVDAIFALAATIAAVYKSIRSRLERSRYYEPSYTEWD